MTRAQLEREKRFQTQKQEKIQQKAENLVSLLENYIDEKIDRAIMMHENENRHELSSCCGDIPDSRLLFEMEDELKDKFVELLS